jgi:hypothetical protein
MNARTLPAFEQPQIAATDTLLCASYLHEGLSLDLYGSHDEDGYEVTDVALAGSKVSLFELVPIKTMVSMSRRLECLMPSDDALRRASRLEQRAEYAAAEWRVA